MNLPFNFSHPWLLLLALVPLGVLLYRAVGARRAILAVPLSAFHWIAKSKGEGGFQRLLPELLRLLAVAGLVPIMAGIGSEVPIQASLSQAPALTVTIASPRRRAPRRSPRPRRRLRMASTTITGRPQKNGPMGPEADGGGR